MSCGSRARAIVGFVLTPLRDIFYHKCHRNVEDPLPLRRAQTTTEAALRRAEKARAPFKAATDKANAAAEHAAQQRAEAGTYTIAVKRTVHSSIHKTKFSPSQPI